MSKLLMRVGDRKLSLWQSFIAAYVKKNHVAASRSPQSQYAVLRHDMVQATNTFVNNRFNQLPERLSNAASKKEATSLDVKAHLSELAFDIAQAKVEHRLIDEDTLTIEFRRYSDADTAGFLTCATDYAYYMAQHGGVVKYNDWTIDGKGDINYGLINYKLPNNAKVGIIGDWGTGLPDAYALLYDMVVNKKVDAIIHLGDIYYAATPDMVSGPGECKANYAFLFENLWASTGKQLPVFTIPGNHDYYSAGYGYYDMVTNMNNAIPGATQPASYFCLRTEDNGWQFLGMDTGYYDANPSNQKNPYDFGPGLTVTEWQWQIHKLDTFDGNTVLLSHHQLYSANAAINGMYSDYKSVPYSNTFLFNAFGSYFPSKVAGWLWGHEHNLVLYADNQFGLAKGRLIGASAYEEETTSTPYQINYPLVKYLDPTKYQLSAAQGYYNHSYAVIDLSQRVNPTDPVSIGYYEFPSWGDSDTPPVNPQGTLIDNYTETFKRPAGNRKAINYSNAITLQLYSIVSIVASTGAEFKSIGPYYSGVYNYPQLSPTNTVILLLELVSGNVINNPVKTMDIVFIKTIDLSPNNYIGAFQDKSDVYYYNNTYDVNKSSWQIVKQTPGGDPAIYAGDIVSFRNISYNQWLKQDGDFLTTDSNAANRGFFLISV